MSGEYLQANTIEEYWEKLKAIYKQRSSVWEDLTSEQYEQIEHSEREDSDNHLNMERLGKDTKVIDICLYKYLPERYEAYHIRLVHEDGSDRHYFFKIKLNEQID